MKKGNLIKGFCFSLALFGAVSSSDLIRSEAASNTDSVSVTKVNVGDDFAMGMDISSIIALENAGVTYYDQDGNKKDLFTLAKEGGCNYIRIRVWNDPKDSSGNYYGGGNNDLQCALKIGERATKAGIKVLIDLHMSDFWTDPSKYKIPKAWENLSEDQVASNIDQFTKSVLDSFKAKNIDVGMIQIGNETNTGFCGALTWKSNNLNPTWVKYINAGLNAVSEWNESNNADIKSVLHFARPDTGCGSSYSKFKANNITDFDIFATSYYPQDDGSIDGLNATLIQIAQVLDKKVMVAETNYPFSGSSDTTKLPYGVSVGGQAKYLQNLISTMNSLDYNEDGVCDCEGVFYWEPAWPAIGDWEKYGTGWASAAAKSYGYSSGNTPTGSIALVANKADKKQQVMDSFYTYKYIKTGKKKLSNIKSIAVNKNANYVSLKWSSVSGAAKYKIYRTNVSNGVYTLVGTTNKLTFADKSVKAGKNYFYFVRLLEAMILIQVMRQILLQYMFLRRLRS